MYDRPGHAVVDGGANAVGKLTGMFGIERDAVCSEMQRAADQALLGEAAINREQLELEEMSAQVFDLDALGGVAGHRVGQLVEG